MTRVASRGVAISLALLAVYGTVAASSTTTCFDAMSLQGVDAESVDARCGLGQKSLDLCAREATAALNGGTGAALANLFAADCQRNPARWDGLFGASNRDCQSRQKEAQQQAERYVAAQAKYEQQMQKYQSDLARYDAWQAEHCPQAPGTVSYCVCFVGCLEKPVEPFAPLAPSAPDCEVFDYSDCNGAALAAQILARSPSAARQIVESTLSEARRDLAHECDVAKLRIADEKRRELAEQRLQKELKRQQDERTAREAVHTAADRNVDQDEKLAQRLGVLGLEPRSTFVAVAPEDFRPQRIKYGVAPENQSARNSAANRPGSRSTVCEQVRNHLAEVSNQERRLAAKLRSGGADLSSADRALLEQRLKDVQASKRSLVTAEEKCASSVPAR